MLQAGQTNNITFKVNVMGTSSTPSVRVVLGTDPELSYPATNDGDNWMAAIKVPDGLEGTYSMRVEVVLNNRLFTPITKSVSISAAGSPAPTPNETTTPTVETPDAAIEPAPTVVSVGATKPTPEPVAKPVEVELPKVKHPSLIKSFTEMPKVIAKMPEVKRKVTRASEEMIRRVIPATIAVDMPPALVPPLPKKTAGLSMLKTVADKPAKKTHKRIVTDMPKTVGENKNVSVSIASVDAITGPTKAKITETIKVAKSKAKTPIKLIKEHLFYE